MGDGLDGLWALDSKYSLLRNEWDVQDAPKKSTVMWRGILLLKRLLMENIKYQVGSGERILFWKDRWVGDSPLGSESV